MEGIFNIQAIGSAAGGRLVLGLVLLPFLLGMGLSRGLEFSSHPSSPIETTITLKPGQSTTLVLGSQLKISVRAASR